MNARDTNEELLEQNGSSERDPTSSSFFVIDYDPDASMVDMVPSLPSTTLNASTTTASSSVGNLLLPSHVMLADESTIEANASLIAPPSPTSSTSSSHVEFLDETSVSATSLV